MTLHCRLTLSYTISYDIIVQYKKSTNSVACGLVGGSHAHARFLFDKVRHQLDLGTVDAGTHGPDTSHQNLDEGSIMGILDYDSRVRHL